MIGTTPEIVLLSPAGGQVMYGIVEYFKKRGTKVIGIDRNPEAIGKQFVDKFFAVPDIGDQEYMDSVLKIIIENKIDTFISWLDPEIIFWNDRFYASEIPEDLIKIFTFNFTKDLIKFCDKFIFHSLLNSNGFNCPKMSLLGDNENERNINLPAIIKPRMGFGTKNTYIIRNEEAFKYFSSFLSTKFVDIKKFIIQEFLEGIEYTIDFFSQNGKIKNLVIRKRIEHKGVSLKGEIVHNKKIEILTDKFCSTFNINGLNNIQVFESGDNLFTIEYNPRPSGTIMLSINAGVDFLNNVREQRYNKEITEYGRPKRLRMIRYLAELYYE